MLLFCAVLFALLVGEVVLRLFFATAFEGLSKHRTIFAEFDASLGWRMILGNEGTFET